MRERPGIYDNALEKLVHPIDTKTIPGFGQWLFLNGYRYPNWGHAAFDFSAWKDEKGRIMLGLPRGTPVFSPLPGVVAESSYYSYRSAEKEFDKYQAGVKIIHNATGTIATSLWHIMPLVEPGETVDAGQKVGEVYSTKGTKKGCLIHLHVAMRPLWPGSYAPRDGDGNIDPLEILYPSGPGFERLALPSNGPDIKKAELTRNGIHVEYEVLMYQHIVD